jgi:hypothetical protein
MPLKIFNSKDLIISREEENESEN